MAGIQQLIFDLIARDSASPAFQKLAAAAGTAGGQVSELSKKVTELGSKSANVRLKLDGDTEANATLDRLDARLLSLAHKGNMKLSIEGAARAAAELSALELELDNLSKKGGSADKATSALGALAGKGGVSGMGALIAGGVALSPVVLTLGTGLAGLAAAAYGTIKPIEQAAQKTGGLQANLKSLDPQERAVAQSLHVLGQQYDAFQNALKPELLGIFDQSLRLAGQLMHDVEPVAAATGKAFSLFLGQFGATLQDAQWKQFWAFMAQTAPTDMRLLGSVIIDLTNDLPVLVRDLQPAAEATLKLADGIAKLTGGLLNLNGELQRWQDKQAAAASSSNPLAKAWGELWKISGEVVTNLKDTGLTITGQYHPAVQKAADITGILATQSDAADLAQAKLAPQTAKSATAMHDAAMRAQLLSQMLQSATAQTVALMTAQQNALSVQVGYGTSLVTTANDAATLQTKLKASGGQVGLQTQAQRDSFAAANTYITDLGNTAVAAVKSGHGVDAAITAITNGLPVLDSAKTKNKQYWQEVKTLVGWLDALRAEKAIMEAIHVNASGVWSVTPGKIGLPGGTAGGPFARGGLITAGTTPTADDVLIRASRNETVLSAAHSAMLAPLLAQIGVPGYAGGGVIGSYFGSAGGLPTWANGELAATVSAVARSTAQALVSAIQSAVPVIAGGPGGGAPGANAALARSMMPAWASGAEWAAWNYVAMRESGWNQFARNLSSGAYGIPQALPPSKLPFSGQAAGGSNPAAQIGWMIGYISQRYGDPIGAAAHEAAFNWYDSGGILSPGLTLAVNRSGRAESVLGSRAEALLEQLVSLVDELCGLQAQNNGIAAAAPARTGAALSAGSGAGAYGVLYP